MTKEMIEKVSDVGSHKLLYFIFKIKKNPQTNPDMIHLVIYVKNDRL